MLERSPLAPNAILAVPVVMLRVVTVDMLDDFFLCRSSEPDSAAWSDKYLSSQAFRGMDFR